MIVTEPGAFISDGISLSCNVTKYCRQKNIRIIFHNAEGEAKSKVL
ncbi:hypothetical protein [Porphyromonas gulae]|nr:hypothetical protein [Porphyromonas gulae]